MRILILIAFVINLLACQNRSKVQMETINNETTMISIDKKDFGVIAGEKVDLYTLRNKHGFEVKITNYGGIVSSLLVPDRTGKFDDVVLGYDKLENYLEEHPFFGAIIGRYGNRIANGKFSINGHEYSLATNNGDNSLHGGDRGFDKYIWQATEIKDGIRLKRQSPDMEEGYPGNLKVAVDYQISNDNELIITYKAQTDKPTVCNLTNHSYFNLAGEGLGDILDHEVQIFAEQYNPVDEGLIPIGVAQVRDTPFDFNSSKSIGLEIDADHPQIALGGGYDHNFILSKKKFDGMELAAVVKEASSGRKMEVYTSEPAVQFYCGNFLDGTLIGKRGNPYVKRSGFCLETQHYPDSPNQAAFPNTILRPDEVYTTKTIYKFSVID